MQALPKPLEKTKAYSYVRISSKGQVDGTGISRQVAKAREYAEAHGLELDEELRDIGKSGFHGDHVRFGELGAFIKLVKKGQVPVGSYLLVEALDRLSREDVLVAQQQFIALLLAGINIVTLIDQQVYHRDSEFGQLILSLSIMKSANDESARKSARIKHVIKARKDDISKGLPRYNHHLVGWIDQIRIGDSKDYEFRLNERAASVRRIFELADQGIGAHTIARMLNDENLPVMREKANRRNRWKDASVWSILTNETVIGTYYSRSRVNGKLVTNGTPVSDFYPAAVDPELFWRVQRKRELKKAVGRKGRHYSNLFARNTACAHCGKPLRFMKGGAKHRVTRYLTCQERFHHSETTCPSKCYRYDRFEEAVLLYVTDFHRAAMELHNAGKLDLKRVEREISRADRKLEALEVARQNAIAMSLSVSDPRDRTAFVERINNIRGHIAEHEARRASMVARLRDINDDRSETTAFSQKLDAERKMWTTSADDNQIYESRARVSAMLDEFITMVEVDFNSLEATVWVAGFTSAYRFDNFGNLKAHINLVSMFEPIGDKPFIFADEQGKLTSRKLKVPVYKPAFDDQIMINFMQSMRWPQDRQALALEACHKMRRAAEGRTAMSIIR